MSTVATATAYFEEQSSQQGIRQRSTHNSSESRTNRMIPMYNRRTISTSNFTSIRNVLFILILITFVFIIYSSLSLSPLLRFLDPYSYVLVFDAGSTGTRIHVYKFRASTDNDNGDTFVLKDEIFKERKPGLSSFADNIEGAQAQIDELLQIADKEVSRFKHRSTPLVLRATAGLRLINENKQKLLLEGVSKSFGKYGFYRPKLDIAIMNETEEGIDAWLTLVYLKGEQFYGSRIAALDLGGGSTQITYNPALSNTSLAEKLNLLLKMQQPVEPEQIQAFRDPLKKDKKQMPKIDVEKADLEEIKPVKILKRQDALAETNNNEKFLSEEQAVLAHMHQFRMFRRDINLYSRSYLGYGLMIARQLIFINETNDQRAIDKHQLKSTCFVNGFDGKFKFQEITWNVQAQQGKTKSLFFLRFFFIDLFCCFCTDVNSDERFYACMSTIDRYVGLNVQPAIGLDQMSIYVFSYFYDIANDAGLLAQSDDSSVITTISVRALKETAKNYCRNGSQEHPFLCFDLTYLYSLLTKGYGLSEQIEIHICKKIQQFEVAWSLGLALKLL